MLKILLLAASSFILIPISAQGLVTDRPDQTESSSTLLKSYFQIETGLALHSTPEQTTFNFNNTLLRLGLIENLELRLAFAYDRIDIKDSDLHFQGIGDLEIGVKYRIAQGKVELAYLGHVVLPTGDNGFTIGTTGFVNRILIAHDLSETVSIGYNLGFDYFDSENHGLTYTCSVAMPLADKLGFFIEVYGDWPTFYSFKVNTDSGITYLLKPNLQLDLSFGLGLTEEFNFISAGVSWRIPD